MKALCLSLAVVLGIPAVAPAQSVSLTAAFDWSVPARMGANGMPGVTLPFAGSGQTESDSNLRALNPERSFAGQPAAGWPVDFDACPSTGDIASFKWAVDGQLLAHSENCKTRIQFPREGLYDVVLTVTTAGGASASTAQKVNVQDFLIVGLGDSFGSGEGVPNEAITSQMHSQFVELYEIMADAQAQLAQVQSEVDAAEAAVVAAQQELATANNDLDNLVAAGEAFIAAQAELTAAKSAYNTAQNTIDYYTPRVAAAALVVAFECAQLWDPAGCTAAKNEYNRLNTILNNARTARNAALGRVTVATASYAAALLTVPVGGFTDAIEILSAGVSVVTAKLNAAKTNLLAKKDRLLITIETVQAAQSALDGASGNIVAKWQDSVAVNRSILNAEAPRYRPNPYSPCHQSKFSGQARAALAIEQADPKTSVTFIHLACTGAVAGDLLNLSQDITDPEPDGIPSRSPQLPTAFRLTEEREIDAFVMSIGGNDANFAAGVEKCVTTEPCFAVVTIQPPTDEQIRTACDPAGLFPALGTLDVGPVPACVSWLKSLPAFSVGSTGAQELVDKGLATLPQKYANIQSKIAELWPDLPSDRTFITPYPNASRDQDGNTCGYDPNPAKSLPGISPAEFLWAEQYVLKQLNGTIELAADSLGWTFVDGIENDFYTHGICANEPWMVRAHESFSQQMDALGTAHPNAGGQQAYANRIREKLEQAFYPHKSATSLGPARVASSQ